MRKLINWFTNTNRMSQEVKRQHYVPRTYLKHFATSKGAEYFIDTLPISSNTIDDIKSINIKNVCTEKHLYTLTDFKDTNERMLIERFYSDNVEKDYDAMRQILLNDSEIDIISLGDRVKIIATVVTMLFRTSWWINQFNKNIDRILEIAYKKSKESGYDYFEFQGQRVSTNGLELYDIQRDFQTKSRQTQVISQLRVAIGHISQRISNDGIHIVRIDDDYEMLTSDNPVMLFNPKLALNIIPTDVSNVVKLVLDTKHILYLMPYAKGDANILLRRTIKGPEARFQSLLTNIELAHRAERFLLGTKKGLSDYIQFRDIKENELSTMELEYVDYIKKFVDENYREEDFIVK